MVSKNISQLASQAKQRNKKSAVEAHDDAKTYGPEPDASTDLTNFGSTIRAYNWYNYMCTGADARQFAIEGNPEFAELYERISDDMFPTTLGWIMRLKSHGVILPESTLAFVDKKHKEIEAYLLRKSLEVDKNPMPAVAPKWQKLATWMEDDIGCDLEEVSARLTRAALKKSDLEHLTDRLRIVAEGVRADVEEEQSERRIAAAEADLDWLSKVIEICTGVISERKSDRAPRKTKPRSSKSILRKFVCCPEHKPLEMKSIDAEKVLGAKLLWVYNHKRRMLMKFESDMGLSVERRSLANVTKSGEKRIRKPEEVMKGFASATPARRQRVYEDLKTVEGETSLRINDECVLLRVD